MSTRTAKPLGGKCYGSIPHLPGSRLGPGDHHCHEGQSVICTQKVRDKHDRVIVQQKYDGSCVGVYRDGDEIIPLTRAGYLANTSPYEQHHLWWDWALARKADFLAVLEPGERIIGEWLAQAHGTRYTCNVLFEPFVAFDIMRGLRRMTFSDFVERVVCGVDGPPEHGFNTPSIVGYGPMSIAEAVGKLCNPWAIDELEGVVYRVERLDHKTKTLEVDFLAKYVRPTKTDGIYLPEVSGKDAVWNWRPTN